jgi:hypothetical protein
LFSNLTIIKADAREANTHRSAYFGNICTCLKRGITNATTEGLNAKILWAN